MAGDTLITVVGNLTADPELRFTPSGAQVANFTVASTPRSFDRTANEWKDGETLFLSCSVWRDQAEHVAESLTRGTRVIVQGRLKQRSYETSSGEKRTVVELDVEEVGPSLRSASAEVRKGQRSGAALTGRVVDNSTTGDRGGWGRPGEPDPWATPAPAATPPRGPAGGWEGQGSSGPQRGAQPAYDEPPF
jgi:single-strand DNA-binding protein